MISVETSQSIRLNLLNFKSEIWRRTLICDDDFTPSLSLCN